MDNLLPAYKAVRPRRCREISGLYDEDFEPGDIFEHRPSQTILERAALRWDLLAGHPSPRQRRHGEPSAHDDLGKEHCDDFPKFF